MESVPETVEQQFWHVCRIFSDIADRTPTALDEIRDKFERNASIYAPVISEDLILFNDAYFFRNVLKVLIALNAIDVDVSNFSLLRDAGCGVGTATIAALASGDGGGKQVDISLEDHSLSQLDIAKTNIEKAIEFDLFAGDRSVVCKAEISSYADNSFTIGSYILCELLAQGALISDLVRTLRRQYLLIDYGRIISEYLREGIFQIENATLSRLTYSVPKAMEGLIGQSTIRVNYLYVW